MFSFITRPLFNFVYRIDRRKSPIPPIIRVVRSMPAEERSEFDHLLDSSLARGPYSLIDYQLPYPKVDFLNYICDWRGYVAHGSPLTDLSILEPVRLTKDSSEFGNRQQIFCSPDGTWALWFAILDKSKIHVTENGCVRVGHRDGSSTTTSISRPKARKLHPSQTGWFTSPTPGISPNTAPTPYWIGSMRKSKNGAARSR